MNFYLKIYLLPSYIMKAFNNLEEECQRIGCRFDANDNDLFEHLSYHRTLLLDHLSNIAHEIGPVGREKIKTSESRLLLHYLSKILRLRNIPFETPAMLFQYSWQSCHIFSKTLQLFSKKPPLKNFLVESMYTSATFLVG